MLRILALILLATIVLSSTTSFTFAQDEKGDVLSESANAAQQARDRLDAQLDVITENIKQMNEELGIDAETAKDDRDGANPPKDKKDELLDILAPSKMFGVGELRERMEAGRAVADTFTITEREIGAMERYTSNEFDEVTKILQPGLEEDVPFSHFLLGCALFELHRYPSASAEFRTASEGVPFSTLPILLAEISDHLKDGVAPSDSELLEAYDEVYQQFLATDRVSPLGGLAGAVTSPIALDPFSLRMDDIFARVAMLREQKLLKEFFGSKDINREMTIAALFSTNNTVSADLWSVIADRHPHSHEAQVMALLVQEFDEERRESEAQNIAQLQTLEPDNGVFILLDIACDNYDKILNNEERILLARAISAKSFQTYKYFNIENAQQESLNFFGGLASLPSITSNRTLIALRRVMSRIVATADEERKVGHTEAARTLLDQAELLLKRYEPGSKTLLDDLIRLSLRKNLSKCLEEHAIDTNDSDLLARVLEIRAEAYRMKRVYMFGSQDMIVALQIPLLSFKRLILSTDKNSELMIERAWRVLRLYSEDARNQTMEFLNGYVLNDMDYSESPNHILSAELLKLREALPTLRKMTQSKLPFNAYLAKQAIAVIEADAAEPEE